MYSALVYKAPSCSECRTWSLWTAAPQKNLATSWCLSIHRPKGRRCNLRTREIVSLHCLHQSYCLTPNITTVCNRTSPCLAPCWSTKKAVLYIKSDLRWHSAQTEEWCVRRQRTNISLEDSSFYSGGNNGASMRPGGLFLPAMWANSVKRLLTLTYTHSVNSKASRWRAQRNTCWLWKLCLRRSTANSAKSRRFYSECFIARGYLDI